MKEHMPFMQKLDINKNLIDDFQNIKQYTKKLTKSEKKIYSKL